MKSVEIKRRFFEFFERRDHVAAPPTSFASSTLNPFITSGIEPYQSYFLQEVNPLKDIYAPWGKPLGGLNAVSAQRCFRIEDAGLVGDDSHLTSFEMLGAYTFGGYKKQTAIKVAIDFFKLLNLSIDYVTIFGGSENIFGGLPPDKDAEFFWTELGLKHIQKLTMRENFWGPTGAGGICGPTSEVFVKDAGVWSIISLDYFYPGTHEELVSGGNRGLLEKLSTVGMASVAGLERLTAVVSGKSNVYETDFFENIFLPLASFTITPRQKRIIADHLRTASFIIAEAGDLEKNSVIKNAVQRLLRRLFVYEKVFKLPGGVWESVIEKVVQTYGRDFKNEEAVKVSILATLEKERIDFSAGLVAGLKDLSRMKSEGFVIGAEKALELYDSFGLQFESIKEFGGPSCQNLTREDFEIELEKHKPVSERKHQEERGVGSKLKELWNKIS